MRGEAGAAAGAAAGAEAGAEVREEVVMAEDRGGGDRRVMVESVEQSPGSPAGTGYDATIGQMSEKWRALRQEPELSGSKSFVERNYLALGIGIGAFLIALLIVIGGVLFLVWNGN